MNLQNLLNYAFLLRTFRNGGQLVKLHRRGEPCHEARLWDGTRLVHPRGRGGLVGTILELWRERCYTPPGFWTPADGDVVVDAGAHVGLFSIWLASRSPGCRIIAIEPFHENYACLRANLAAAGAGNVEARRVGVGGGAKVGCMRAVGDRSIDHLLRPADSDDEDSVPVLALADILEWAGGSRVAFFKLDVEGAEYDLFESAGDHELDRVDHWAMEYHDHLRPGALDLIRRRLEPTHRLQVIPTEDRGYGVLLAKHHAI